MAKRDYYEALGVDRRADDAYIKKAYRNLAMKHHPDRNPGDTAAAERMKEINEAYAVLSDPQKRRLYDTYGHAGLEGYSQEDIFRGVDFSTMFREFGLGDVFGFGDSLFDSFFGRTSTRRRGPQKGADLRYDLSVTLEEVAEGAEKTVKLTTEATCPGCRSTGAEVDGLAQCGVCQGTGQVVREHRSGFGVLRQITTCDTCRGRGSIVTEACKTCNGNGIIEDSREFQVNVPAGAESGHAIRLPGEGQRGPDLPGDLYVVLNVQEHTLFQRKDDDIYLQQEIDVTEAALGAQIEVPSLNGTTTLEIPEGTQTGTVFKIREKGIPHLSGHGRGDEYVVVKVMTPAGLSPREKQLLREFRDLRAESGGNGHGKDGKG
ncbi:MAG: molecular chaperone DnaJ [Dehalococcoidia bacterium]